MTGPDHYREAERLLGTAASQDDVLLVQFAQVHATLALAAAQALSSSAGVADWETWTAATNWNKKPGGAA